MFLNQFYLHSLSQIALSTTRSKHLAENLLKLLPDAFVIKDLILLFDVCTPPTCSHPLFAPDAGFYTTIGLWKSNLEHLRIQLASYLSYAYSALTNTDKLKLSPHVICFKQLLQTDLLGNPCMHSHKLFVEFIRILLDPDLPLIMSHLSQLEEIGSSATDVTSINDRHVAILKLKTSLKMQNKDDIISKKAGKLLEITLTIYENFNDIINEKIQKLRSELPPVANTEDNKSGCSMM